MQVGVVLSELNVTGDSAAVQTSRCSAPRSVSSALPVFLQFSSNCLSQKKFRRSLSLLGTEAEEGGGGDISIAFSISYILHTTNYPSMSSPV